MKRQNKTIKRTKMLPDKIFKQIWDASEQNDVSFVIQKYTSVKSKDYINFEKKYNIEEYQATQMIRNIHASANLTFKEILTKAGKRKVDIANTFFIPLRTIDDWYSGATPCKACHRIVMIRQFHLLNLGKYISLESEIEYKESIPKVYEISGAYSRKATELNKTEQELTEDNDFDEEFDELNAPDINEILGNYNAMRSRQKHKTSEIQSILNRTEYLKDRMTQKTQE